MEVINEGSEDVFELSDLSCCFPAGSMSNFSPEA